MHTYTHKTVLPRTNHREHTPHSCTHTHTRQYCLVRITVSIRLIRAHTLPCSANYMMRNTQSNTCMHRLAINHSEHAHCTRPDTHTPTHAYIASQSITVSMRLAHALIHIHTCMHRLTAITVSMHLVHQRTHKSTCIIAWPKSP